MIEVIDTATRRRLIGRYGPWVVEWCERLPALIDDLARRWRFRVVKPLSSGSGSCVFLCERSNSEATVLKLTPHRTLGVAEASALATWRDSGRVPRIIHFYDKSGAFLMEAIRPGTTLVNSPTEVRLDTNVELVRDLHASAGKETIKVFHRSSSV